MSLFPEVIERLTQVLRSSEEWLEFGRDLRAPISFPDVPFDLGMRWAEKGDLEAINALEGYVKEVAFLESSLESGDRCLIFEKEKFIEAFAWVTLKDYPLNIWHTLRLPPGYAYLVYIYVQPEYRNQKVGTCLLGCLMKALKELGFTTLIAGMYSDWEISLSLHSKHGFRLFRRYTERKLLRCISLPPRIQNC